MPKSNYAQQMALTFFAKSPASISRPTTLYLALLSTAPSGSGIGTSEVTYDGYQRQAVTFGTITSSGGSSAIANEAVLTFGVVPSASGNISYCALMDAQTNGNMIYFGPLAATYALNVGVQPIVPVGSLTVSET
jgi:hypothetical protein